MQKKTLFILIFILAFSLTVLPKAKTAKKSDDPFKAVAGGLKFRSIGPAFTSGRIADIVVNPKDHSEFYVGVASGNIWKTVNNGITFKPVFDKYGSYSIGALAIDPKNPKVVWAGTGENNHQRALAYGDGVYKSVDGGKSWTNMGLKESRQIGRILIHPKNTDIVYVAAEGSAWGPGGDRGLFKTVDGGKSWEKVLNISENTGVNEMVMDPCNPDVIIAASEQRRRHVHTKIGGGPETGLHKTTDGGKTWRKINKGLPGVHKGGIGLAMSPADHMVIYATFEAQDDMGGFFRSDDQGESWKKMSSHSSSGQYYSRIFCDPKDVNKVYSVETVTQYTEDGGKTFKRLGLSERHVDDHALWINPEDTRHLIIGGDGGVYITYDSGSHWFHVSNLPVTQFYRVFVDNSKPFYYIYGGTQDNNSMGGPTASTSRDGVTKGEWFITNGGDGFWSAVDPVDPNIVYAEAQYGVMVRYDRKSGERRYIRPVPRKGEKTYKWNWNTPLIISHHKHTRIYCAANKIFRSDDRGDSWTVISDDLTSKTDRNTWKVMGKYWSADAVAKDVSTSQFGTIVSLDESTLDENLLAAGTDDGVIQITTDGGKNWTMYHNFPGVPKYTYVSDLMLSRYDKNTVYASFDNRKRDDFTPYVLMSADLGKTWKSIASNLPKEGTIHTLAQDHVKKELLFAGSEFGVFFSVNSGKGWTQLKSGLPTISVRDMMIQRDKNDLALATFGRGFYILDDYTPLRELTPELLKKEAHIFPVRESLQYIRTGKKYGQGATDFLGENPAFGATFTYYLKDSFTSKKALRKKKEAKQFKKGEKIYIPTWDELREEGLEPKSYLAFTVTDDSGNVVKRIYKSGSKGMNRVVWDFSMNWYEPLKPGKKFNPLAKQDDGFPAMPGKYKVTLSKVIDGQETQIAGPVEFTTKILNNATLPAKDRKALNKFHKDIAEMSRVIQGNLAAADHMKKEIVLVRQTLHAMPAAPAKVVADAAKTEREIDDIIFKFRGHRPKASREEIPPGEPTITSRFFSVLYAQFATTAAPSGAQLTSMKILREQMMPVISDLKKIGSKINGFQKELEKINAPWTPGRVVDFK